MIDKSNALANLPQSLRVELLDEFSDIVNAFMERRWRPAELSGARFCEIVYSILKGYSEKNFPSKSSKPRNMVDDCKALENKTSMPRSFRILIPRFLPGLYEIRNQRNVGHVGGDVDPDFMDSSAVVSLCSWIMAELIRVFHELTTAKAQRIVDNLVEFRHPLIWQSGEIKRVLRPDLKIKEQMIILIGSESGPCDVGQLFINLEYKNRTYLRKLLKDFHGKRFVEYSEEKLSVELLPPGRKYLTELVQKLEDD